MHKIAYDQNAIKLQELYGVVRRARTEFKLVSTLPSIWKSVIHDFPNDWLLSLEILEILRPHPSYHLYCKEVRQYLENKSQSNPHLEMLIVNGLKLLEVPANT